MKEIKYECWVPSRKTMHPWEHDPDKGISSVRRFMTDMLNIPEATFRQYIGLNDRHKKEIYHFDILRLTGTKELSLVVWHFNRWALRDSKGRLREFNKLDFEAGWFEIVGNNFENPQLLKESKNVTNPA